MKILVVSDTHRDFDSLYNLILNTPEAQTVIHLGDGEEELFKVRELFKDKKFINVKGNCDVNSSSPETRIETINNKKIFITHGHKYKVKSNLYNVLMAAKQESADILLFGHTHTPFIDTYDSVQIMNPGSLGDLTKSYGILDLTGSEIVAGLFNYQN